MKTNKLTKLNRITVKNCEELESGEGELQGFLFYRGIPVAKLFIDWGWTRYYRAANGLGGFGTFRNTGYFHYDSSRKFRREAARLGE